MGSVSVSITEVPLYTNTSRFVLKGRGRAKYLRIWKTALKMCFSDKYKRKRIKLVFSFGCQYYLLPLLKTLRPVRKHRKILIRFQLIDYRATGGKLKSLLIANTKWHKLILYIVN